MLNIKKINEELKKRKWNDSDFARELGIQRQHMSYILRVNKSCSVKMLSRMAKKLNTTMDDLWEG